MQSDFQLKVLIRLSFFLDELVRRSEETKTDKMLIGMAHRGRLNVLTHILNNPYEMFFALFAGVSDEPFLPKDGSIRNFSWLVWGCRLSLRCNV